MTRDEMITEVRDRVGDFNADDPYLPASVYERAVRAGLRAVDNGLQVEEGHYPWLEASTTWASVSGQASYTLPSTFRSPLGASFGSARLRRVGAEFVFDNPGSGTPSTFAIFGDKLVLSPAPTVNGTTITLRFVRTEVDLTSGSATPLLPERFQSAVVEHAVATVLRRDRRYDEASAALGEYERIVALARSEVVRPVVTATRAVSSALDFDDLVELVRNRPGVAALNPVPTDEGIRAAINQALAYISELDDWVWLRSATPQTITLAAGDDTYALPAGWKRTITLGREDAYELRLVTEAEITSDGREGKPLKFAVIGSDIVVRPVPVEAGTLTHHYWVNEAWLASGSDEPLLPREWRLAVVEYVVAQLLRQEPTLSGQARNEFERLVAAMRLANRQASGKASFRFVSRPDGPWGRF